MSYPANHIPEARDGVEGLLEQIATSVGAITDDASSVEDKLASIAVALRLASLAVDSEATPAEAAAVAAGIAAMTPTQVNATLAELGLVDSTGVLKWLSSNGAGVLNRLSSYEALTNLVLGFEATTIYAWQTALFNASVLDVTDANYTIQAGDVGQILRFNRPTDIEVTCPKAFPEGFNCCWLQKGNGQVHFVAQAGGSAAVVNIDSHAWSKAPYAVGSLIVESNADNNSAIWYLAGATAIAT